MVPQPAVAFEQSGGSPPPSTETSRQAQLKAAVQALPEKAGIDLANWNWKVVRRFVQERFGLSLSSSSCLNYLHRLGFVLKRPKKHFLKADDGKREALVAAYAARSWSKRDNWGRKSSSLTRPISGRMRTCGGNGYSRESRRW